jgi:hypothetical protein
MQDDDVERVARALCALRVSQTSDDWLRYRQENSWILFVDEARAAMVATLELAAEALRVAGDDVAWSRMRAADWLQQRANDVKEPGNG